MPALTATIGLTDNLTTPLRNISNAISAITANMGDMAKQSGASFDPKNMTAMQKAAQSLDRAVGDLEREVEDAADAQKNHNKQMKEGKSDSDKLSNSFSGLAKTIGTVVAGYVSWQTVSKAIELSDQISQTTSRLNLMNDGLQTTSELQENIRQAALNSHAEYQTLADTVAKIGNNAGSAFSSSQEIVDFAEQLSKQFAISGASAEEMSAATLQLTQALGSGVLRGDEFNSVMEQAPGIAQMMADYLEVDKSQIRDLASEGALTAEVVKNAVLGATDETNRKFDQMAVTFTQLWTDFKTNALFAFNPIAEALSGLANNPEFQAGISRIGELIADLGPPVASIVSAIGQIIPVGLNAFIDGLEWIADNGAVIASLLVGIGSAMAFIKVSSAVSDSGGIVAYFTKLVGPITELIGLISPMGLLAGAIVGIGVAAVALVASGKSVEDVAGFFNDFQSSVTSAVSNVAQGILGMVENIKSSFPQFAAEVGSMMPTIIEGILSSAMTLLSAGAEIAIYLLNGFLQALPSIIQGGFSFVSNFVTGIFQAIPSLVNSAQEMVIYLMAVLAEILPDMMENGAQAVLAFATGIGENLPSLISSGLTMIGELALNIANHLPEFIEYGMFLLQNLIRGFVAMLPSLISTGLSLILTLGSTIIQNLPVILETGIQIIVAIVSGIVQSIPVLLGGLGQAFLAFFDALAEYGPQILSSAGEIALNLWEGFKQGISEGWTNLTTFVSDTFNGVIDFVKGIFGVHSPSTVFAEIGGFLLEGLGNGIQSMWSGVSSIVSGIGNAIKDFLTPDVDYAEMIANTRSQIEQLKADVASGYDELKTVTLSNGQQMASGTVEIYRSMATAVLAEVSDMGSQMISQMLSYRSSFADVFNGIKTEAISYLVSLTTDAASQISKMISVTSSALTELTGVYGGIFGMILEQTLSILEVLQNSALETVNHMIGSIQESILTLASGFEIVFSQIGVQTISVLESLYSNAMTVIDSIKDQSIRVIIDMSTNLINSFTVLSVTIPSLVVIMASAAILTIVNMNSQISSDTVKMSQNYISIWLLISSQTQSVIANMSTQIKSLIANLVSSILATMNKLPPAFRQIGKDMMDDLAKGIQSQTAKVVDVTNDLVQQLKQVFITGLGIHSPAAVIKYYAEMAGLGWIKGLSSSQMVSFTESRIEDLKAAFRNGKFDAAELVDYLDEDTLKVISYLERTGDQTVSENYQASANGVNPLIGGPYTITSYFGGRTAPTAGASSNHGGMDIGAPQGTQIVAAFPGTVSIAGVYGGYGNAVMIEHSNGMKSLYGHMSAIQTSVGAQVNAGQAIGLVGSTGISTGAHLHYEIRDGNGSPVDPLPYYNGEASLGAAQMTLAQTIQQAYNQAKGISMGNSALGNVAYNPTAGVEQWRGTVETALSMLGLSTSYANNLLSLMQGESSGNPNAINKWDSNWIAGTPSKGLMQVIDPTFKAYALPGYDTNIYDPLSNILASIRYQLARYGKILSSAGYAKGTDYATPGLHWVGENGPELLQFRGGERVYTNEESMAIANSLAYTDSNFRESYINEPAERYVDTDNYYPVNNSTTTNNQTNNSPINFQLSPTINTKEEFNMTVSDVERMFLQMLRNVSANNAEGLTDY